MIQQLVQNDISSTKVRLFLRRDMSIRYLVPEPVVQYIEENGLFDEDGAASTGSSGGNTGGGDAEMDGKGKGRVGGTTGPVGGMAGESKGVSGVVDGDGQGRSSGGAGNPPAG